MPDTGLGPTSRTYFSQRLRLHYVDWGNPQARPVILVHGGRDHCRSWDWVARDLARDYHVIAPDLRGHGDSQWAVGGSYTVWDYVYDLYQLLHQTALGPVNIVAHSYGGIVSLRYAGLYPDTVRRMAVIEGLGFRPAEVEKLEKQSVIERGQEWIANMKGLAARQPRRYPNIEEAVQRMRQENPRLSEEQARHLTEHGMVRNEDGTFCWKYDNYFRVRAPYPITTAESVAFWREITCPVLLFRGTESWATDPVVDGRASHFRNVQTSNIEGAGHWVHHDRLEPFLAQVRAFLAAA